MLEFLEFLVGVQGLHKTPKKNRAANFTRIRNVEETSVFKIAVELVVKEIFQVLTQICTMWKHLWEERTRVEFKMDFKMKWTGCVRFCFTRASQN